MVVRAAMAKPYDLRSFRLIFPIKSMNEQRQRRDAAGEVSESGTISRVLIGLPEAMERFTCLARTVFVRCKRVRRRAAHAPNCR